MNTSRSHRLVYLINNCEGHRTIQIVTYMYIYIYISDLIKYSKTPYCVSISYNYLYMGKE